MKIIRKIYDWMGEKADSAYGRAWLITLFFIESSFFIIPVDPLLILFCIKQRAKSFHFAMLATLASVAGGLFGYIIGALFWDICGPFFLKWVITQETFDMLVAKYRQNELLIVLIGGFTPIPYKAITISAGICKLPLIPFLLASLLSRGARFYLVAGAIYIWGEKIKNFIDKYFNYLVVAFTVIVILSCKIAKGDSMPIPEMLTSQHPSLISLEMPSIKRVEGIIQNDPKKYVSFAQGALKIGGVDQNTKEYVRQILLTDKADYYNDALGFMPLRKLLTLTLENKSNTRIDPEQVMITHGGVGGLSAVALSLLHPDDEVILPEPAYPIYQNIVKLAKAKAVSTLSYELTKSTAGNGSVWRFSPASIEKVCTPKTKMVIISNPSNPCGCFLSKDELYALATWCQERGIYLVVDEVYDDYIFEGNFTSSTVLAANMSHVIRTGSFSKSFGMSGWRIGFVVGDKALIAGMAPVTATLVSCPTMAAQYGAMYALEHSEVVAEYAAAVGKSRELVCDFFDKLQASGLVTYARPAAGFYLFFSIPDMSGEEFVQDVLEKAQVGMAAGGDFGPHCTNFVRLCYSRDLDTVQQGISRLQTYFTRKRLEEARPAHTSLA